MPRYTLVDDDRGAARGGGRLPTRAPASPTRRCGWASSASAGGAHAWVDLAPYAAAELLIVDVRWTPDGQVAFQVQDREQTWLDLNLADARRPLAQAAARDDAGVGGAARQPALAGGRDVPLAQRAQRLEAPLSRLRATGACCGR